MKKLMGALLIVLIFMASYGCSGKQNLYVLNWGEYMDRDLVREFEKEYNVTVKYKEVGSNEEMGSLLLAGTSVYDIVIPSDYMIDKLRQEELIQKLDFTQLTNFDGLEVVDKLYDLYNESGLEEYIVPYAWGTIGIMYNTDVPGLGDLIQNEGWKALFDYGDMYKVGMYDSPRDAVASALLYLGYNVNSEVESELQEAEDLLKSANFFAWGEDNLKSLVIEGTLDMALVYSGDYFSEYYLAEEDERTINFDFVDPNPTNVWLDAFVIPTISQNVELAHQFINFFLREEICLQNADYIGYASPYQVIFDQMTDDLGYDFDTFDPYPEGTNRQMYVYGSDSRSERIYQILEKAKAQNE